MEIEDGGRSVHELMMGRPAKQQAYEALVAYYRGHGWTHDTSSGCFDVFEPPVDAAPHEIAEVQRGADAITAGFGFGVQ